MFQAYQYYLNSKERENLISHPGKTYSDQYSNKYRPHTQNGLINKTSCNYFNLPKEFIGGMPSGTYAFMHQGWAPESTTHTKQYP